MADGTLTYRHLPPLFAYKERTETHLLIVHDSHTVPGERSMIEWLKLTARRRGLLDIGYHYVIFENGELVCCRPRDLQGSHCRGFDRISVGVCLIGGLSRTEEGETHVDTFTPAQRQKLRDLHAYLNGIYPGIELRGHTECGHHANRLSRGGPACPTMNLEEFRCGP